MYFEPLAVCSPSWPRKRAFTVMDYRFRGNDPLESIRPLLDMAGASINDAPAPGRGTPWIGRSAVLPPSGASVVPAPGERGAIRACPQDPS